MDRYMARYFDQQTDNRPDQEDVVEVTYDDATAWCVTCAGPIFPGTPATVVEAFTTDVVDRHGDTTSVSVPAMAWHSDPEDCQPEDGPSLSSDLFDVLKWVLTGSERDFV